MSVGAVNKQTGDRIPTAGMPAIDSVLSGTSTNPVQNRVVKAAIDDIVNSLVNYYLKTETYSKTEVDSLLQAITTLDIQAVNTLPTTNISTTTIYLVPKQDPQVPDVKDEYINLDGTTSGWELIGNTQIDLSNYVTTSDLTTALQSYATKAYVDGLIGNLSSLTTTDKSSCVGAINEVVNSLAEVVYASANVGGDYTGGTDYTLNSFTIVDSGTYLIVGKQYLTPDSTYNYVRPVIKIYKNNSLIAQKVYAIKQGLDITNVIHCNSNDVISLVLSCNNNVSNLNSDYTASELRIVKLSNK